MTMQVLEKINNELENLIIDPNNFIFEFFNEIQRQIDIRKEECIKYLDEASIVQSEKIIKQRAKYYERAKSLVSDLLPIKEFVKMNRILLDNNLLSEFEKEAMANQINNKIFRIKGQLTENSAFFLGSTFFEPIDIKDEFQILKYKRNFFCFEYDLNSFPEELKPNIISDDLIVNYSLRSSKYNWLNKYELDISVSLKSYEGEETMGIWLNCQALESQNWYERYFTEKFSILNHSLEAFK